MKRYFIFICFLSALATAQAQIQADWIVETQYGRLPGADDQNQSTLYGDLGLRYSHRGWSAAASLEAFGTTIHNAGYQQLHQRYLEYSGRSIRLRAGHFFTSLGRGLVLRAFELPNVLQEQRSFRRRYAFYRDIDGFLAEGKWQKFEVTLLAGKPLSGVFPPRLKGNDRRMDSVYGGQVTLRPWTSFSIGDALLLQKRRDQESQTINTLFAEWQWTPWLKRLGLQGLRGNLYLEQAAIQAPVRSYFKTGENKPRATYAALNISNRFSGLSVEYKSYRHFETGINVPPLAYKEHTYYLLNRSTHDLLAESEKGYQIEWSLRPVQSWWLSYNYSRAENDFGYTPFLFMDHFMETQISLGEAVTMRGFYDWARDDLRSISARYTAGANVEWLIAGPFAAAVDLQLQQVDKQFGLSKEQHKNLYTSLTLSKSFLFSWGVALERSTDPEATDDPGTPFILENSPRHWMSTVFSIRLNSHHEMSLFYGKRRGGLACLSGTCYEVLPFEGVEVRWLTQL